MTDCEIVIVGAGIAGLCAATLLQAAGFSVVVVEKSSGVGGRMASRRIGDGRGDHGAQFITARSSRFKEFIQELEMVGIVQLWFGGDSSSASTYPRWRGAPAMTAIAKYLAANIRVRQNSSVINISSNHNRWRIHLHTGEVLRAGALLLTPPVPQAREILNHVESLIPSATHSLLKKFNYAKCLAVLATLRAPSGIKPPGFLREPDQNIDWITDNQQKGISARPALTIQASAEFSRKHWDEERQNTAELLIKATRQWVTMEIEDYQIHGWKYSKPLYIHDQPYLEVFGEPPLLLAGDAFAGPKVEGAALSGWAAAEQIKKKLL